eukprot:GHVT01018500.1.p1 GENE.GHVT01018500.1~~GHVT01018500.1.p1  ORF type:complete len:255 (+),score=8.10 GHVT01018500.1:523-1287(+)
MRTAPDMMKKQLKKPSWHRKLRVKQTSAIMDQTGCCVECPATIVSPLANLINSQQAEIWQSKRHHDKSAVETLVPTNYTDSYDSIVSLNVGGQIYQTRKSTLLRFPNSKHYFWQLFFGPWKDQHQTTLFLDRDGKRFSYILDFLRDGFLSCPDEPSELEAIKRDAAYLMLNPMVHAIEEQLEQLKKKFDSITQKCRNCSSTGQCPRAENDSRHQVHRHQVHQVPSGTAAEDKHADAPHAILDNKGQFFSLVEEF